MSESATINWDDNNGDMVATMTAAKASNSQNVVTNDLPIKQLRNTQKNLLHIYLHNHIPNK